MVYRTPAPAFQCCPLHRPDRLSAVLPASLHVDRPCAHQLLSWETGQLITVRVYSSRLVLAWYVSTTFTQGTYSSCSSNLMFFFSLLFHSINSSPGNRRHFPRIAPTVSFSITTFTLILFPNVATVPFKLAIEWSILSVLYRSIRNSSSYYQKLLYTSSL